MQSSKPCHLHLIAQPLHILTRNDSKYFNGSLPPENFQAFYTTKNALISEPVVTYPRADHRFALVSEVHVPTDKHEVGMSSILCQIDSKGSFHALSHASGWLQSQEANYSLLLPKMANAINRIDIGREFLQATISSLPATPTRTVPSSQENSGPVPLHCP